MIHYNFYFWSLLLSYKPNVYMFVLTWGAMLGIKTTAAIAL